MYKKPREGCAVNLHESGEDYLETILRLREEKGQVRSIDVAGALSVSKPSVSVAMKKLRDSGHIEMDEAGLLTLTAALTITDDR